MAEVRREGRRLGKRKKEERGTALLLVLLFLPVLTIALGMTLDLGFLYYLRQEARGAADLGALAGVQELDFDRLAEGERWILPSGSARARELTAANLEHLAASDRIDVEIKALRLQAGPENSVRHPWSGQMIADPTVAVRVELTVRPFFLPFPRSVRITVDADASMKTR